MPEGGFLSFRGIQKIFFQDLTGNLISLDSESSWTLCKSLQSLKEQRHISLVIKVLPRDLLWSA